MILARYTDKYGNTTEITGQSEEALRALIGVENIEFMPYEQELTEEEKLHAQLQKEIALERLKTKTLTEELATTNDVLQELILATMGVEE